MDDLDRRILNTLQENFPLKANPYQVMARNLDISEDFFWSRVTAMKDSGVIRRMGFSIDSAKMGFASTLAAVRVPDKQLEAASEVISEYPQITHSYLRADTFNIWFTIIAESRDRIETILKEIQDKLSLDDDDIMNLPVQKLFKLDARFKH